MFGEGIVSGDISPSSVVWWNKKVKERPGWLSEIGMQVSSKLVSEFKKTASELESFDEQHQISRTERSPLRKSETRFRMFEKNTGLTKNSTD